MIEIWSQRQRDKGRDTKTKTEDKDKSYDIINCHTNLRK